MNRTYPWVTALMALMLVIAACGPQMATPTLRASPSAPETAAAPAPTQTGPSAVGPSFYADLPVDPNNWHVLGSADALVTIVEYSDFQ